MYKIAILGCENSHADMFLDYIYGAKSEDGTYKPPLVNDVSVVGVFSEDMAAAEKLSKKYGVPIAASFDEFVGKLDGVMVTARHGDNHYKYLKPYLKSGIPMFIDKPITISEAEAIELKSELIKNGIRVTGGSVCKYPDKIMKLKEIRESGSEGKVFSGMLRAPVNMNNPYGNFYFYSQHLVEAMCTVFGFYPNSVKAFVNDKVITAVVRYDEYDVVLTFTDGCYEYGAGIITERHTSYEKYELDGSFEKEFYAFYSLLSGGEQQRSYDDFIAPVFILCALDQAIKTGEEVKINKFC